MAEQPEMYSVALAGGNKCTVGFRTIPITPSDFDKVLDFLALLKDNLVAEVAERLPQEDIPAPMGNAGRVMGGIISKYLPTEQELADASNRVHARENFIWTRQAMEEQRQSAKSSRESGDDSQS